MMVLREIMSAAPRPEDLPINDTSGGDVMGGGSSNDTVTMTDVPDEDDDLGIDDESIEKILEAIFAVRIQNGLGPDELVSFKKVENELENRYGDLGYGNEIASVLERIPERLLQFETGGDTVQVALRPEGRDRVLSQDSGTDASAGGLKHRLLCGKAFVMATALGFNAAVPSQEEEGEQPDAVGEPPIDLSKATTLSEMRESAERLEQEYPAIGKLTDGDPLTVEVETSTFEKPFRTIRNLRKAVNDGRYCLFFVADGSEADDLPATYEGDPIDYYAKCIERVLYETRYDRSIGDYDINRDEVILAKSVDSGGNRIFYNDTDNYTTVEGHEAVREAPDDRGDTTWREDGDEIIVEDSSNGKIGSFESPSDADSGVKTGVSGHLEYNAEDDEWIVWYEGDKHYYSSKEEALVEWERFKAPYIPDNKFDEWPTADDFGIVIMPDKSNPDYNQPQLYDEGDLYPLYDYFGVEPPEIEIGAVASSEDNTNEDADADDATPIEGECPECGEQTTFSEGGPEGTLQCDSCGYTPPKETREAIRDANTESDDGDKHDETGDQNADESVEDGGSPDDGESSDDNALEGECPNCDEQVTFSEGRAGLLQCDTCGVYPPDETQEAIRAANTDSDEGDGDEQEGNQQDSHEQAGSGDDTTPSKIPETEEEVHRQTAKAVLDTHQQATPANAPDDYEPETESSNDKGTADTEDEADPDTEASPDAVDESGAENNDTGDDSEPSSEDDTEDTPSRSFDPKDPYGNTQIPDPRGDATSDAEASADSGDDPETDTVDSLEATQESVNESTTDATVESPSTPDTEQGENEQATPDDRDDADTPTPDPEALSNEELRELLDLPEDEREQVGNEITTLAGDPRFPIQNVDEAERLQLLRRYDPDEHGSQSSVETGDGADANTPTSDPEDSQHSSSNESGPAVSADDTPSDSGAESDPEGDGEAGDEDDSPYDREAIEEYRDLLDS